MDVHTLGSAKSGNWGHQGGKGGPGNPGGSTSKSGQVILKDDHPITLQAAGIVRDVMEEMKAQGYLMPSSITIYRSPVHDMSGQVVPGTYYFNSPAMQLYLPDTLPADADLNQVAGLAFDGDEGRPPVNFAVQDFRDIVVHEMGHVQSNRFADRSPDIDQAMRKAGFVDRESGLLDRDRRRGAMASVSVYATQNADEFMAEAFTRLYRGERLTPDAQKLYEALKGPEVKAFKGAGGPGSGNFGHGGGEGGKGNPGGSTSKADRAEEIVADAKATGKNLLFHSGDASQDDDLAVVIEPRFGDWQEEVLSGATDEEETANQIREQDPVAFFSEEPSWVTMKASRAAGKHVTQMTVEDVLKHGQLSIVVEDPDDTVFKHAGEYGQGAGPYKGEIEKYADVPLTVESYDIFTDQSVSPEITLTGEALLQFLARNYPDANLFAPGEKEKFIEKYGRQGRLNFLGGPGSGNWGHQGRPGEVGGSAPTGRRFESEEGYLWHETGPVAAWAHGLSDDACNAISGYSGFGYTDINNTLRGKPPTKTEEVRDFTDDETRAYVQNKTLPALQEDERVSGYGFIPKVVREVEDTERTTRARESADRLNQIIRDEGYILEESIVVSRGAYLQNVSNEDLLANLDMVQEEVGFTSTMLGPAAGRVDMYPAGAKAQSIYDRHGKIITVPDSDGTAVEFEIVLPKGTKVASVEAARRISGSFNSLDKPDMERSSILAYRSESEILLGSGARFLVRDVMPDIKTSTWAGFKTPVTKIRLEYIGGGASEGGR